MLRSFHVQRLRLLSVTESAGWGAAPARAEPQVLLGQDDASAAARAASASSEANQAQQSDAAPNSSCSSVSAQQALRAVEQVLMKLPLSSFAMMGVGSGVCLSARPGFGNLLWTSLLGHVVANVMT